MDIESNKEILEARKKMAELYGNVKLGGKGINFYNKRKSKKNKICCS